MNKTNIKRTSILHKRSCYIFLSWLVKSMTGEGEHRQKNISAMCDESSCRFEKDGKAVYQAFVTSTNDVSRCLTSFVDWRLFVIWNCQYEAFVNRVFYVRFPRENKWCQLQLCMLCVSQCWDIVSVLKLCWKRKKESKNEGTSCHHPITFDLCYHPITVTNAEYFVCNVQKEIKYVAGKEYLSFGYFAVFLRHCFSTELVL